MNTVRRRKPKHLGEAEGDSPHYYGHRERLRQRLIDYCTAHVANNKVEEFHILFLDRKNVLIRHERQQRGTIDHTPVYPREVVKRALELGASALILGAQPPLGRSDPVQSRHHGDPGHQEGRRPARGRATRPCNHRP